jgi:hypothetical protein
MSDPPPTVHIVAADPQTVSGVAVRVAGNIVDVFRTSPVLLLIVLLNMAFCAAAAYYLVVVEDHRTHERDTLIALLEKCTMHTVPLEALPRYFEQRERDAK